MLILIIRVWYAIVNKPLERVNYRRINRGYPIVAIEKCNGTYTYVYGIRNAGPLELAMIDAGLL